jgi:predicted DNA-binding protein (UPF0251 family)
MSLTAEQFEELGLTPEEGRDLLRLTTKIEQSQQAQAQSSEIARRSFEEWVSDVLPKVLKALGIAAGVVARLLNSITDLVKVL